MICIWLVLVASEDQGLPVPEDSKLVRACTRQTMFVGQVSTMFELVFLMAMRKGSVAGGVRFKTPDCSGGRPPEVIGHDEQHRHAHAADKAEG